MKNASIFGGAGTFVRRSVMMTLLLAGTFSVLANAETIYRWVGSNGVVSYGENPPAGAQGVEQIAGAPQQSVSTPAEVQRPPEAAPNVQPGVDKPELNASNPARKRLEAELVAARLQLLQATHNYQQGKAIRTGNERNYARYLQRVNGLKQEVDNAQMRVMLLQHQLEQIPETTAPASPSPMQGHQAH